MIRGITEDPLAMGRAKVPGTRLRNSEKYGRLTEEERVPYSWAGCGGRVTADGDLLTPDT